MNHRLFEEWLFADDPLEPEQLVALRDHLENCDTCRRLCDAKNDTDALLKTAPMIAPNVGFTSRWQARWVADQRRRQRNQTLLILAFYLGGVLFFALALGLFIYPVFFSPQPLVLALVYRLTYWIEMGGLVLEFISTLLNTILSVIPPTLWIGIGVAFTSLCVLWIVAFRKLTTTRRIFA
jgi:predicted anti-sigma-YlaC factor YlaD